MKKSELRSIIHEMVQEELAGDSTAKLQEKLEGPGYVIKAWASPEQKSGTPAFDSAKANIMYPEFEEVIAALQSADLSELGAYEITWVKSGTATED